MRIIRNIFEEEYKPEIDTEQTPEQALSNKDKLIREIELHYEKEETIGKALEQYCTMRDGGQQQRLLQVDFYNREIKLSQKDDDIMPNNEFDSDEEEKKGENDSYLLYRNQNTIYDLIKQRSGVGNLMRKTINKGKAQSAVIGNREEYKSPEPQQKSELPDRFISEAKLLNRRDLNFE